VGRRFILRKAATGLQSGAGRPRLLIGTL